MQDEIDIMGDVSSRLDRGGFEYMLTGSVAMNFYAQPRMTRDIDIVVALSSQDADSIVRLFWPDYYVSREAVAECVSSESVFNLIHQESIIKVDCIFRKGSPYHRAEFARRRRVTVRNFSTWIASKEDLILSKLLWAKESGSEQQMRDVANITETGWDADYIEHWTRELGVVALWEKCKK